MSHEEIYELTAEECRKGILSCSTAKSVAKKYGDIMIMDRMDLQIGAFQIQIDMIAAGDINGKGRQ
jgi:hypothetical protein